MENESYSYSVAETIKFWNLFAKFEIVDCVIVCDALLVQSTSPAFVTFGLKMFIRH